MAYEDQARGGDSAYDRYLKGMDAAMRQKVALTAAHLLSEGDLADMGMGSGSGSHALAALYPGLSVVGVDVNPEMVERAGERYRLPNLRFVVGDIAKPCFEPGTLEAVLDSSVLHHVTSFNGYDHEAAGRAIAVQAEQLAPHGVLIVRDFLAPAPGPVHLDLPTTGGPDDDPMTCSAAALLERFAREFRILSDAPGFELRVVEEWEGWRRYALDHRMAVEFVLRKDYRRDWGLEVQEEYTYATQAEFEAWFSDLGLRVLASTPIWNPWIVANRFEGKFALWSPQGERLDDPPTNFVIVGQKVPPGGGVTLTAAEDVPPIGYLELSYRRHRETGAVYDLVRRPNTTFDVLPWFEEDGAIRVLARRSYPRPIVGRYVSEPLNVQQRDKPLGQTVEELLEEFPGVELLEVEQGPATYPSPGGLQEQVCPVFVKIRPVQVQTRLFVRNGFSTSGTLRAIEARQLLRAAQVGALPDSRLEQHTYELLLRRGVDPGAWIGAELTLTEDEPVTPGTLSRPRRRAFERAGAAESTGFLKLKATRFVERDAAGEQVGEMVLESVVPSTRADRTVACAVLRVSGDDVLIGLDDDDLPAAQSFTGHSEIFVAPAWRLPHSVGGIRATRAFVAERIQREYGLVCRAMFDLGGPYHPSAGVTAELVTPLAIVVSGENSNRPLTWIRIEHALEQRARLADGHLRTLLFRAAHALGKL